MFNHHPSHPVFSGPCAGWVDLQGRFYPNDGELHLDAAVRHGLLSPEGRRNWDQAYFRLYGAGFQHVYGHGRNWTLNSLVRPNSDQLDWIESQVQLGFTVSWVHEASWMSPYELTNPQYDKFCELTADKEDRIDWQ